MDEPRPDLSEQNTESREYEPPRVEDLPTEEPVTLATDAGGSPPPIVGPEWCP
jgi:hypothetical protein